MAEDPTHPEATAQPRPEPDGAVDTPYVHTHVDEDESGDAVSEILDADQSPELMAPRVEELEAPEAAEVLETLEPEESAQVVKRMEEELAAEALAYMDPSLAVTVLMDLEPLEAAGLVALMEPDDAADILQAMPKPMVEQLLSKLHPRQAAALGKLVLYDPESAGGIMTTGIIVVPETMTIGKAIEFIQRHEISPSQHDVYCVDDQKRLVGAIGLRELLLHPDKAAVGAWMERDLDAVLPTVDREAVARLFEKYDYLTVPVVDEQRRVLGMITVDDVIDIIAAEHTEDAYKQVGAGAHEAVYSPVHQKFKGRFPWLLVNLLTSQIAASVLFLYKDLIELVPVVVTVFPVIANQAGNAGQQSLAVTLRGLVRGEIRSDRVWPLIAREIMLGVVAGVSVGLVLWLSMWLIGADMLGIHREFTWRIGLVAGVAMAAALCVGCLVGTLIPLLLDRTGFDPATGSSIFLTMMTDGCAYLTFLTMVYFAHGWMLSGG